MKVFVEIADLKAALKAVAPHADPDKDMYMLHRVNFVATRENLFVSATNRYSVGCALVSVWDSELTGSVADDQFDLTPAAVKEVALLFSEGKDKDDGAGDLQIEVSETELTFTDVSGLFPGKSFTTPRTHVGEPFVNLPRLLASTIDAGRALPTRLATNGRLIKLFAAAAQAYGMPLVIEPSGRGNGTLLVSCGESFMGALTPLKADDGSEIGMDTQEWKALWGLRMQELAEGLGDTEKRGAA